METSTRFYQNLLDSYNKKSYLLKSKPESFTREIYKSENDETYLNLHKIYMPIDYSKSKPNSYKNKQTEKSDYEIFEPVDTDKFNFTKKNKNETIMYFFENDFCSQEDEESEEKIEKISNSEYATIVQNIFPLVNLHMLILPFYAKILPQYLNDHLILERIFSFQKSLGETDLM